MMNDLQQCEVKVYDAAPQGASYGGTTHRCKRRARINVYDRGVLVASTCTAHARSKYDTASLYVHRPIREES